MYRKRQSKLYAIILVSRASYWALSKVRALGEDSYVLRYLPVSTPGQTLTICIAVLAEICRGEIDSEGICGQWTPRRLTRAPGIATFGDLVGA